MKNFLKNQFNNLKELSKKVFVEKPIDLGKGLTAPIIEGYINPFIEVEVIYKGESLMRESLGMVLNTRLKDYFLMPVGVNANNSPEITLTLPTGAQLKVPLYLKNLDDKPVRQRGDGLTKNKNGG